jgi:PKD repeat protein
MTSGKARARRWLAAAIGATISVGLLPVLAAPGYADSAPVPPVTARTVTADSLPTVQINGVVWDQVVVGDTVYATGSFTQARPAGAAAGTNETPRSNILAYRLSTGALVTGWAPSLNAQGLAIEASADGSRIFVAGEFTSVSGVSRSRLVALDATTGTVVTGFNANVNSRVRALDVDGTTLYLGGAFSAVGGQPRSRLAAVDASTGAARPWAPQVDSEVFALAVPSGAGTVVAGGRFQFANGQEVRGLGAFAASDAALLPWPSYGIFPNYGPNSAVWSLSTDGARVYGTGYDYFGPSEWEGSFAITAATGAIEWVNACKGDTYGSAPIGDVLYSVGHPHDCGMIGGHPQAEPWTFQRALATTTAPASDGRRNQYGAYSAYNAPELLHWLPTFSAGTFTGQSQAGWTVTGDSEYVVIGGEFPRVNGTAQQGLSRFRVNGPNTAAIQGYTELTPSITSLAPGTARVAWTAAWDRDNRRLTYEVLRGATTASSVVVGTVAADSSWWDRRRLAFTDTTAPPGTSQTYRVRVKDAFTNTLVSASATGTVEAGTAQPNPYGDAVRADGATSYWRLGEPSGTVGFDWAGGDDLTVDASAGRGAPGALTGNGATTFSGTATVPASTGAAQPGPQTFTAEAWFSTTATTGGKIIGFGNSSTGDSSGYDRHVYMTGDGRIVFGVHPGSVRTITSAAGLNDGRWHHVAASLGADGMELVIDGKRVGKRIDTTSAQGYAGFWRVGGDSLGGWPDVPASTRFTGAIDEVAVYPTALPLARVQAHFVAAGGQVRSGVRPSDTYGQAVYDLGPDSYWRLDDNGGTTAADVTVNAADGLYAGGPVLGVPGRLPGTAVQFDGVDDGVSSGQPVANPTVFSQELWFSTTTTRGGKLIGFGSSQTGGSGSYDRHVWMGDDGRLNFGVWTGQANVATTPLPYNDGQWHHVVATQSGDGMKLYVDGQVAGTHPQTQAQAYTGYWRVGGDSSWGGSSAYFAGTIDDVAVYSAALTPAQVADHYVRGGGQAPTTPPTAAFTATSNGLAVAFDGSTSTDPDGTIAGHAWNFGDGSPSGSGVTPTHTYAAAGTYTVTLTVTDDDGASATGSQQLTVTAPAPNQPPQAALAATATGLAVAVDGSASADPDGTVAAHAWNFGDGATATGPTAGHTYTAAGTYTVTLTVTDDDGATGVATEAVTVTAPPPSNDPPTASFTSSAAGLAATFDGSGSSDPDGTVTAYAWDFGDGASGTGAKPSHTYAAAGSYTVTLTVTDDDGATGQTSQPVSVTAAPVAYAADTFSRTSTSGLGTADTGGAWTVAGGPATDYSIAGGVARIRAAAAASQRTAYLGSVAQTSTEVNVAIAVDKAATGGGTYVQVLGRRVANAGDYRLIVRFVAGGSVSVVLSRTVGTTETTLASTTVPGLSYAPGQVLRVRMRTTGTGTTALAGKVWLDGTAQPAAWQLTATDATAALQAPGAVGLVHYVSGSATNAPVTVTVDDLTAGPPVG